MEGGAHRNADPRRVPERRSEERQGIEKVVDIRGHDECDRRMRSHLAIRVREIAMVPRVGEALEPHRERVPTRRWRHEGNG